MGLPLIDVADARPRFRFGVGVGAHQGIGAVEEGPFAVGRERPRLIGAKAYPVCDRAGDAGGPDWLFAFWVAGEALEAGCCCVIEEELGVGQPGDFVGVVVSGQFGLGGKEQLGGVGADPGGTCCRWPAGGIGGCRPRGHARGRAF